MSVLTDPATYGILDIALTSCPRTAAELGELEAQWQQMMGTCQRVEQETVSSQCLANAIENMIKTRIDATRNRLRTKDGERLSVKSWTGSTPLAGFAREVAARLGYVDPKHEAGELIQRITKGTLSATKPWTDGRHVEDDKYAKQDFELAVARANVTEGAARSTVLKVTRPSHRRSYSAGTHTRDTSKMQGRKGIEGEAHSMVLECGRVRASIQSDLQSTEDVPGEGNDAEKHQTGVPDGTEKVRRNHDDGAVPVDLGNVGAHDAKMTQSDSHTSNDMSYDDVCAIA